jgi:hypothetical protein
MMILSFGEMMMKSNYLSDEHEKADFFMLASQIYVRLRRVSSRVIDAVYMVENEEYAREIIRMATLVNDVELHQLAGRLQQIMAGAGGQPVAAPAVVPTLRQTVPTAAVAPAAAVRRPVAVVPAVVVAQVDVGDSEQVPEEVSHHYIGALR